MLMRPIGQVQPMNTSGRFWWTGPPRERKPRERIGLALLAEAEGWIWEHPAGSSDLVPRYSTFG